MARKVVHIDGDILVYACGFAAEKGEYQLSHSDDVVEHFSYKKDLKSRLEELGNPPHVVEFRRVAEPVEYALSNVKILINSIREATNADDYFVYLSGPTNFRETIATLREYKGNRDKSHKPVHGPAIRDYIRNRHPCVVSVDEEADDVIGYSHYARWEADPESSVIATQDKDLDMIPGMHYNFAKRESYVISPEQADYNFYKQLLMGDPTDNIPGIAGVGPAKAAKLLAGEPNMYEVCRKAYDNDDELLENARLLWIRRTKGELWNPPSTIQTKK